MSVDLVRTARLMGEEMNLLYSSVYESLLCVQDE